MDNYEESLTEKIENARNHYESLMPRDLNKDTKVDALKRIDLLTQIDAYQDALITYRNLKAKGEI